MAFGWEKEIDTEFEEIKFRLLEVHMLIMKLRLIPKRNQASLFKVMSFKSLDSVFFLN